MTTTVPYNDVFYGISALISVTFFMGDNVALNTKRIFAILNLRKLSGRPILMAVSDLSRSS